MIEPVWGSVYASLRGHAMSRTNIVIDTGLSSTEVDDALRLLVTKDIVTVMDHAYVGRDEVFALNPAPDDLILKRALEEHHQTTMRMPTQ